HEEELDTVLGRHDPFFERAKRSDRREQHRRVTDDHEHDRRRANEVEPERSRFAHARATIPRVSGTVAAICMRLPAGRSRPTRLDANSKIMIEYFTQALQTTWALFQ